MAAEEVEQRSRETEEKVEEAIRAAMAQAEEMARKAIADLLGGKVDQGQLASVLQGMMARLPSFGGDSPYRALGLDPSAPDELVKLAYRYLARKHHPDRGGSQERMAQVNRAYEAIGRERGWKS